MNENIERKMLKKYAKKPIFKGKKQFFRVRKRFSEIERQKRKN